MKSLLLVLTGFTSIHAVTQDGYVDTEGGAFAGHCVVRGKHFLMQLPFQRVKARIKDGKLLGMNFRGTARALSGMVGRTRCTASVGTFDGQHAVVVAEFMNRDGVSTEIVWDLRVKQ
jgi:hypothetical protein